MDFKNSQPRSAIFNIELFFMFSHVMLGSNSTTGYHKYKPTTSWLQNSSKCNPMYKFELSLLTLNVQTSSLVSVGGNHYATIFEIRDSFLAKKFKIRGLN